MAIVGLVLVGIAALVHVFIFYLESFAWTTPRTRAIFGIGEQEALATKELAFNQGFYNLFLAIAVFGGIILFVVGLTPIGATAVFLGAGSMVAAAFVLMLSNPSRTAAALKQGVIPALGVLIFAIGLVL